MDENYYTLALAALLHDIGKVGQRAYTGNDGLSSQTLNLADFLCPSSPKGYRTHIHVLYTNEFCEMIKANLPAAINPSDLANLASYHHRPSDDEQKIVTAADHLSSAMEREMQEIPPSGRNFRTISLSPVVGHISTGPSGNHPGDFAYAIKRFSYESIYPYVRTEQVDLGEDYLKIWNGLIETIGSVSITDELKFINVLLSIVEKFLWAVPSATNVETPDISLFDHMKTTAAIAGCLQSSNNPEQPFLLVAGDFGGIQKYVFNLRAGLGGMAKALRGRSFEVNALTDSTAMGILYDLRLSLAHMIIAAGGRFYLLLPNTEKTLKTLIRHRDELHEWILEEKHGELRFNLAWMETTKNDILDFPATLNKINQKLAESSLEGLSPLKSDGKWNERKWVAAGFSDRYEDLCKSCYVNRISKESKPGEDEGLCNDCRNDRNIGRDFVKASYQIIVAERKLDFQTPFSSYRLSGSISEADKAADLVVDFHGKLQDKYDKPFFTILKNNYVPQGPDGNVLEFEKIAERSEGKQLLGYLKADVDNLGFIFSKGLVTEAGEGKDRSSISRLTTLSRSLEYFFSGFVYDFLEDKYPNTYTVFSGGDDLLLIGPWDQIFILAGDLRSEFARYTCQNPSWSLSAGIAVAKPKTPVLHVQRAASKNLALSKKEPGKDSITALHTTLGWDEYSKALAQGDQLTEWLKNGTLNSAKVHRFYGYALELQRFRQTGNTTMLKAIPQMIYDLKRNWGDKTDSERKAKGWAHSFTNPDNYGIKILPFICQYALCKVK